MARKVTFQGIPFGRDKHTGKMKDVFTVSRGLACNCKCPMCEVDLVAKQGEVKVWHFAHSSEVDGDCKNGLLASIKAMAKQMMIESERLHISHILKRGTPGDIPLTDLKADLLVCGMNADVVAKVNDFNVAIFFDDDENRILTKAFDHLPPDEKLMAVSIDMNVIESKLAKLQESNEDQDKTYIDLLRSIILDQTTAKQWLYHPDMHRLPESEIRRIGPESTQMSGVQNARRNKISDRITGIPPENYSEALIKLRQTMDAMCTLTYKIWTISETELFEVAVKRFRGYCLGTKDCIDINAYNQWFDMITSGDSFRMTCTETEQDYLSGLIELANFNIMIQSKLEDLSNVKPKKTDVGNFELNLE